MYNLTVTLNAEPLHVFQRQLEAELAAINAKWAESDAQFSRTMRIRRYLAERAGRKWERRRKELKLDIIGAYLKLGLLKHA
ncbi:MAG TPA: hypothetical protein VI358_18195 [Pseudolabrys sp.]